MASVADVSSGAFTLIDWLGSVLKTIARNNITIREIGVQPVLVFGKYVYLAIWGAAVADVSSGAFSVIDWLGVWSGTSENS